MYKNQQIVIVDFMRCLIFEELHAALEKEITLIFLVIHSAYWMSSD